MLKRLISLAVALVLCLGMVAAHAEAAPSPEANLPADWAPFAERVTITVPVYDRSKEGYPAVDDNYWTQWVQKEFGDKWNVEVKYVAIPRNDVMTKYALLIAGGETPTILMEYDYPKVAQWADEGAMQTIDLEAVKAVAPSFYQAMVDNNHLGYTDINGGTYFLLTERAYYNTDYTYADFVRMDWLRAVGYENVPANYEEHVDAVNKIIAAGLTDQAPIGLGIPSTAYVQNFQYRDFPVDEKEWTIHSSLGTASIGWEATKAFLKRYNEQYNMGWFSKEFELEKDSKGAAADQMLTDFVNGKLYRYGGYMSQNVDWLKAFYERNPEAELAVQSANFDTLKDQELVGRANNAFGMIVGFSSLATADQLKAAWMLMEWMVQPEVLYVMENGIEGVTYELGENGLPVVDPDYRGAEMLNHNLNIDMTCLVHAAKKVGTIEDTIAFISPQGLPKDFTQELINRYYELKASADEGRMYPDPVFAVAIESESEYTATLLSLYQEYFALLTKVAPEEFEALYADLSQKYLEAGYQEIIDERAEAYEAGMTTKLPQ